MNRPLTNQQQAVYDFIRGKIIQRGYGPTVREIGEHMNIKSPNGVMCHLRALERKGMLTRTANKSRAIELTEPVSRLMGGSLPSGGSVVAGNCSLVAGSAAPLDVGELVAPERYILEVMDDALVEAHIVPQDRLVVQKQTTAAAGQLALVRVGEAETSLRYWPSEADRAQPQPAGKLPPAGKLQSPAQSGNVQVLGVVVGIIRLLEP